MYVVLLVVLVIWIGLAWYLRRIDKKITAAEKKMANISPVGELK